MTRLLADAAEAAASARVSLWPYAGKVEGWRGEGRRKRRRFY